MVRLLLLLPRGIWFGEKMLLHSDGSLEPAAPPPLPLTNRPTNVAGGAKTISRNGGANEQERGDRVVHVGRLGREVVCGAEVPQKLSD